ncbi:dystroglycan-related [Anaeramoeba flamelloides]|uniref:Dystroglycan-related n=1 Tax=Anaeramoeba flamelloides TaxID=1746091 RepID=A0ABQ8Z4L3_9EUKA|nr:dystroglycan-related [Anaeramoeba flamelloides]
MPLLRKVVNGDCVPTELISPNKIQETDSKDAYFPATDISPVNGDVVIVYSIHSLDSENTAIGATLFNSQGTIIKSMWQVNTQESYYQTRPRVAYRPDGKFMVTWIDYEGTNNVKGRIYDATGNNPTSELIISQNYDCRSIDVVGLDDNKMFVVWVRNNERPYGRIVNADGTMSGNEFQIENLGASHDYRMSISKFSDSSDVVINWYYNRRSYGSRYTSSGSKVTHYGDMLGDNKGYYPNIVAFSNNNIGVYGIESDYDFRVEKWINEVDGATNTIERVCYDGAAHKGRDDVAVTTCLKNNEYVKSRIVLYDNSFITDSLNVDTSTDCEGLDLAVHEVHYIITYERSDDIYWSKYELKYPKYVSGLDDLSLDENEDFEFWFSFQDPQGDGLTYSLTDENGDAVPSWIHHDSEDSTKIYGTAPDITGCQETFNFKVTTSKSCKISETKYFSITVDDADPTVEQAIPDQSVKALTADWAFDFESTTFANLGDLSYSAQLTNGDPLPNWLKFEESNPREFSGDVECAQVLQIRVTATDGCSQSASTDFQLTVTNSAPTKNMDLVDQSKVVGDAYEYIFDNETYTDADVGDTLTYTSNQLVGGGSFPTWLEFTEGERKWHGTIPPQQCQEDLNVEIEISDGCASITDDYVLSVTNQAPSYSGALVNKGAHIKQAFEYTFDSDCFTDPELQDITYTATLDNGDPLPGWLSFEESNPRQFTGTVDESECDGDLYVIKVVANDGCSTNDVSGTYELTITNDAPQKNTDIPNQAATTNTLFEYTIPDTYFTDPENVALTYEATLYDGGDLPDWLGFEDENARQFKGTVVAEECDQEEYRILVTVSDGCLSVSDDFYLTITNEAPSSDVAIENQVATTNTQFIHTFSDTCFSDPENVALTYEAKLDDGSDLPDWLGFQVYSAREFKGTPPKTECDGVIYNIKVNASDGCAAAQDTFTIEIENGMPTKEYDIPDQIVHNNKKNYQYIFDEGTFKDPEGVALIYEARLDSNDDPLPDWLEFDPVNRKFHSNTVPEYLCNEDEFIIKVTANDTCATVNDIFKITISNESPYLQNALEDKIKPVNSDFTYTFNSDSFIDPEGVTLTYEARLDSGDPLPDWLEFNTGTRTFSGPIPADTECNTSWEIKVTANDSCTIIEDIFMLTVSDEAPYLDEPLKNHTNYAGNPFDYTFLSHCFIDPEGVQLSFEVEDYEKETDLPTWLNFDSDTRTFSGVVPDENCGEVIHIRVTGKDACTAIENDFYLNITNPRPVDNKKLEPQIAYAKKKFDYVFPEDAFTNEDGVSLTYTAKREGNKDLPSWMNFDPDTRKFLIEENDDDRCSYLYHIDLNADDGCYNVTGKFVIEFINQDPISKVQLENHTIKVEDHLEYQLPEGIFEDPEGESISLSAALPRSDNREFPEWLEFDESEGRFYGTADSCGEPYEIVVSGKDPCTNTASLSWFLTIKDQPPVKQKDLVNQTFYANSGKGYTFDEETFKDPDERELRYEAKLHDGSDLPSWLKFDSDTRTFQGQPEGCSQTLLIDLTAIDPCTTSITTSFQIEIINSPIFVKLGLGDQESDGNTFFDFTIDGLAFDDEDYEHDNYEYTAEMENGDPLPDWLEFRSKERRFIGNTPNEDGQYKIRVYASDSCRSYNVSDTFTITVSEFVAPKSTNTEVLTTGAKIGIIVLSIAVVASLFAFILYRNHLKKKYEKLWDGKQEFFTASMPKKNPLVGDSPDNDDVEMKDVKHSSDSSDTSSSDGDKEKQQQFENKNDDDDKSDIEVSDMSNESDLEDTNTDTSNSDSSLESTSSSIDDDEN